MQIDHDGSHWTLTASVRDTYDLKDIPGARASRKSAPGTVAWRVPGTIGAARQLATDFPGAGWTEGALVQRKVLARLRKARMAAKKGEGDFVYSDERLSPLQCRGVDFLLEGSGILGDDMGAGKTVMASVAAKHLLRADSDGRSTVLVLTTTSTLYVWADHLAEWAGVTPFVFHGPKRKAMYEAFLAFEGPKALISTHALALKHSARGSFGHIAADGQPGEFNEPFDLGIIDEVHKMGLDPTKPGLRALHRIGKNCAVRWALSGTPINESPDEAWNLMAFVEPTVFGDRGPFRKRYCIMTDMGFGPPKNSGLHPDMIEEFDFLFQPYFLRRVKREVLKGLPAALPPQFVKLPMTSAQQTLYNKLVRDGVALLPKGEIITAPGSLGLSRVCQYVANGIPVIDDGDGTVIGLTGPSNKLEYLEEMMAERGHDNPIVVFAHSTKVIEMLHHGLHKAGWRVGHIVGATPGEERRDIVRAFQAGSYDVLLLTAAGAEGITLTRSEVVVFVQESWHAPTNQQVRDRVDRFGQTKETQTIVLLSESTVDMTRRLAVTHKINAEQLVLRDPKHLTSFLTGTWDPEDVF